MNYSYFDVGGRNDAPDVTFENSHSPINPIVNLARAKLLTMFQDLAGKPMGETPSSREKVRLAAYSWFFANSDMEDWCDMAGYRPDYVRKRAKEIHEPGESWGDWRAAPGKGKGYAYRQSLKMRKSHL